jgi:hypothetical protein
LSYQHRSVSGFVTSSAWVYCSTAARFHYDTDPVTGQTTLSVENHVPEAGCSELRQDIDVEGSTFGMVNSLGLEVDVGVGAVGAVLQYSHGMTSLLPGIVSTHLVWRLGF